MKRLTVGLAAGAMVLALAAQAGAQISGSPHDFRGDGWGPATTGEICVVCHTPHNAFTSYKPLWNHEASTVATYGMYDAAAGLDLDGAVDANPTGTSQLCLSCHDGTVAMDNYGGATGGTAFMSTINANAVVGTDLSNDHPISIVYTDTEATADGELYDPTTQSAGLSDVGTIQALLLDADKVQCSSCHDVHNGGDGTSYLLVKDNTGSALCLTCHIK